MPRGAGVGGPIRRGGRGASRAKKLPSTSALQQLDANLTSTMPKEAEWKHIVDDAAVYVEEHLIKEPPITVHGKPCNQRRNVVFFGGRDVDGSFVGWTYNYSKGSNWTGLPIEGTPLEVLLNTVNKRMGAHFNAILVNQYEDPSKTQKPHCIGDHSDNEDGLCPFQGVAIVSHGAKRTMKFKCKLTGALAKEVELLPYSILHMKGKSFQKLLTHGIPGRLRDVGTRTSFTFRHHTK